MAGQEIAKALVEFALYGAFPEEGTSSLEIGPDQLPAAVEALLEAKSKLQADIHAVNSETASDVSTWQAQAESVQDDIVRSKAIASEIMKHADAPDVSGKTTELAEAKASFLRREISYTNHVLQALRSIKEVDETLDQVELARDERRILDALHLLEKSWSQLDAIPVSKSCKAVKLLGIRAFELKDDVHQVFDHVWNSLVYVDQQSGRIFLSTTREDEPMDISDAVIGLRAYKEVDQRACRLWQDLDEALLKARMDIRNKTPSKLSVIDGVLQADGTTDGSLKSLFEDLERVLRYLTERFPVDMVESISSVMIPDIVTRIITVWLDMAVPHSLQGIDEFQNVISEVRAFCTSLSSLGLSGYGELQDWVDSAPRVWLNKCREAALEAIRSKLAEGIGAPKQVEKIEKQMVSNAERRELAASSATVEGADDDWDAAWSNEPTTTHDDVPAQEGSTGEGQTEDDGADAWGWGDEGLDETASEGNLMEEASPHTEPTREDSVAEAAAEEDDPVEAWGWGDDDQQAATEPSAPISKKLSGQEPRTKELVLKETYRISSMPEPVLALISAILEDGATLATPEYESSPVAAAAAGLFSIPTLVLAMFRALSPRYYMQDIGGNMYLYNDAAYLADRLQDFASNWKGRMDISSRAKAMLRLENDVKSLQNFANRAYSNEMNTQRVVLGDLLGGEQNLMQQDETESLVDSAVARVRALATAWEGVLARSVWCQAVGSLVDTISTKFISDVMDLPSIGQDEAYNISRLISTVTELDNLFLPSRLSGVNPVEDEIPTTAQYASSWLRLKYLSEVLQSNLRDVRYLWMESELSLYFTVDEVVDLINLSFEDNSRTREVIREIRQNPQPKQDDS
ncbi:hypothetical protein VTK73DRAFT_515 [Phialemonium thermophilum]|uniref:ZW10 C-terminal helical domain-containing protein n=1 Tax=Phialemonium thermophilum TaxID=223376 RepID=A0ABR3Y4L4_9PEZI